MSKLSFRARALDAAKPMAVYMARELPDLPEMTVINRAVPQMPTGMEKEEETEHHLQRAIVAGLIIPTPEVFELESVEFLNRCYPADTKMPRQLIHMQPFAMEQDVPEYDIDSEDENWLNSQGQKLNLTPVQFEEMMERLEKSSGQTVITLNEAKALLKQDDDLIIAVYDYWLNKRLRLQHPLIPQLKTDKFGGPVSSTNPYIAFRRRTEKMQTRKHRKNDEASYEKMLKLKRDLSRALTLLEMVKKREKLKRELLSFGINVFERRYQLSDFSGQIMSEVSASVRQQPRPPFSPLTLSQAANVWPGTSAAISGNQVGSLPDRQTAAKEEIRKDRRPYRKRRHKVSVSSGAAPAPVRSIPQVSAAAALASRSMTGYSDAASGTSDEETPAGPTVSVSDVEEDSDSEKQPYVFRRLANCSYYAPKEIADPWPWVSAEAGGKGDPRFRYSLASVRHPKQHCLGFVRRRVGRGGRVILDRAATSVDGAWSCLDPDPHRRHLRRLHPDFEAEVRQHWPHFCPKAADEDEATSDGEQTENEAAEENHILPSSVSIGVEGDESSYVDFQVPPLDDTEDYYSDILGSSAFRLPLSLWSTNTDDDWLTPAADDSVDNQKETTPMNGVVSNSLEQPAASSPVWVAPKSGALPSNHSIVSPCPAEKVSEDDSGDVKQQQTVVDFLLLDGTFAMEVS